MIRNAASSLRRAAPGQLVRHPLPPQQCPAGSGLFRTHAVPPPAMLRAAASVSARRLNSNTAAGRSMENNSLEETKSSLEETKSRLVQLLFEEEAATGAARRVEKEKLAAKAKEHNVLVEEILKLWEESLERKAAKKAKAEELLAQIVRQAASGAATDNEALLLARSARDEQEIAQLKETVGVLKAQSFVTYIYVTGIIAYLILK